MYPTKLNKIINLFDSLPEDERRETLVSYADNAKKQEPHAGENFNLVDVRKDEECMDTVGVYLHVDENGKAHIRMTLGPEVQTLHRASKCLHLGAKRHANVRLAVFIDMQINADRVHALFILPDIDKVEIFASVRLLLFRIVRVRDERLAPLIFRQRIEEVNDLVQLGWVHRQ